MATLREKKRLYNGFSPTSPIQSTILTRPDPSMHCDLFGSSGYRAIISKGLRSTALPFV